MHMKEMTSASPDISIFSHMEDYYISLCARFSFLLINTKFFFYSGYLPLAANPYPSSLESALSGSPEILCLGSSPNIPSE